MINNSAEPIVPNLNAISGLLEENILTIKIPSNEQINPNEAKAFYNRGIVYSRLEEIKKAIDDYQNAAQLFGDAEDWNNYQKTLDNLKKIQTSVLSENQNINEDAKYKQLEQQLLRMVGGHWEIAERLIGKVEEKYPGRERIWYLEKVISDWRQQQDS